MQDAGRHGFGAIPWIPVGSLAKIDRWRRVAAGRTCDFELLAGWAGARPFANVATSGYIDDMETGIRKLKDNLSRYIRRIEAGERISVTAHGRVVAELVPPGHGASKSPRSRWDELVAAGILHPPVEAGDPFEDWPDIRLPRGTAAELIDRDRGEA